MPKVIELYRKPEKWPKAKLFISNRRRIEQNVITLELNSNELLND